MVLLMLVSRSRSVGNQPRCSTETRFNQPNIQKRGGGPQGVSWYPMQERRDSHLILRRSCLNDGVHLRELNLKR